MRQRLGQSQGTQFLGEGGCFEAQHGQIAVLGQHGRLQIDRKRRAGEICHQRFQHRRSALPQCHRDFAVAIPGLGYMAIGGQQARRHYKPGTRHARAKILPTAGHMINPIDISDRIAGIVDRRGRHRLLPFQLRDLAGELVHLLLQPGRLRGSVVVRHHSGAHQGQHAQQPLHKPLPGFNHFAFPAIGIEHEPSGPEEGYVRVATILTYSGHGV